MRLGSSTKVWGPRCIRRSRSAAEVCLQGAPGASRSQIAVRSNFTGARRIASILGAKRFLRNLAELAADMWMNDSNPSRTDVDRDGTHLVVRSTHLRNLHVPDPRVAGREDAEFDDAVGDELLDAGPRQLLVGPLFRDQEGRASRGPSDDFPQEDVGEGPKVPDRLERRGHRREGVDHEALGLILIDLAGDLLPEGRQALRGRGGQLEEREPFLGHQGSEVKSDPAHVVEVGLLAFEHRDVHAALLGLLRPVVQEVGSEDRLPGPGPAGQRDEPPGEEPPFEHPVELGQAGRCPLFGARFWNPRHGHLGHAISLFLALCMERATVSKKSVCGARRRMRTGTVTGGSSAAAPAAFESGTSWSGINLNSGYPFPSENLIATGSSTRSVVKTRMFASYMSSARNCVAKSRDRFGSKSLYGNIITALFVARKFRSAVSGTYSCASNGTSPRISSNTVEPRATPPPRRESRSRLPVDMWVSVLSTGRNIAVSAGSLKSNGSRYWNRPPARVNRYWSCRIGTPRSFRISSSRSRRSSMTFWRRIRIASAS